MFLPYVSSMNNMATAASIKHPAPTETALPTVPHKGDNVPNASVIGMDVDLIRFGTMVVAVARRLVPNCSATEPQKGGGIGFSPREREAAGKVGENPGAKLFSASWVHYSRSR